MDQEVRGLPVLCGLTIVKYCKIFVDRSDTFKYISELFQNDLE